jgi:transcriptional regulator with XRE-family HTH domain
MEPSPEVAARFAKNLRRCRERAELSQEELGYRAQLHRTQVGSLERGVRTPRIDTVLRLAGSLSAPMSDLLAGLECDRSFLRAIGGKKLR